MNTPDTLPKFVTPQGKTARNVITDDLLGYEPRNGELEPVFARGFEQDAAARGWPVYPKVQRGVALRHGTIVAWCHGWRIDGIHDLLFEPGMHFQGPNQPIKIQASTRLTKALGEHEVYLDLSSPR